MTDTMTDRELLEAAAEAAGIDKPDHINMEGTWVYFAPGKQKWNPLKSDGCAFRLAVKLRISLAMLTDIVDATTSTVMCHEPWEDDPCAATRRAIVRAAAALTDMESKE